MKGRSQACGLRRWCGDKPQEYAAGANRAGAWSNPMTTGSGPSALIGLPVSDDKAATKTKPRLGSEPGQARPHCGQNPEELQAICKARISVHFAAVASNMPELQK
ncbi:hypothetical protein [Bordetella petrii]|uniref:Uncharacterized protein n=1 Tax=Bordetella petrii TaxID=94624 RepID=A0ABT7W8S8_9BORD|nr:hypothetical protein [Bordetella petrii]MDM9561598.1 hypothetical protein [Bordetella petrii]